MKWTDKQRLDELERLHQEAAPQEWVGVLHDGTLVLDEPVAVEGKYDTITKPRPTIRAAIDAVLNDSVKRKK